MRENAIREAVATDFVSIQHIEGKVNLADLFTKEDKDTAHFIRTRDLILGEHPHSFKQFNNNIDKPDGPGTPSSQVISHSGSLAQGGVNLGVGSQAPDRLIIT